MSDEVNQMISFWGGIASIIALFGSIVGGFLLFLKKLKRKHKLESEKLWKIRDKFSDRAKSATTQGKRMDLFIYHQTLLSSMQSSRLSDELGRLAYFVFSISAIFFMASLDDNANYLIDRISGKNPFFYDNYLIFFFFTLAMIVISNLQLLRESNRHKKVMSAMTDGLLEQLREVIEPSKS